MGDVRLYVAVPSARDHKPQFTTAITSLVWRLGRGLLSQEDGKGGLVPSTARLKNLELKFGAQASCLSGARQAALKDAIESGSTHLLFLDDDMSFEPDVVDRLLAHNKPVVTANYTRKDQSARDNGRMRGICLDMNGEILDSTGKTGIQEIKWTGLGCILIDLDAIKHVPAPHFEVVWSDKLQEYFGEDYIFSFKLREHGVPIFCDHDLSQSVRHVGDYAYGWKNEAQFAEMQRALKEAA